MRILEVLNYTFKNIIKSKKVDKISNPFKLEMDGRLKERNYEIYMNRVKKNPGNLGNNTYVWVERTDTTIVKPKKNIIKARKRGKEIG